MMEETGTVIELKGKHVAVVICKKSSFCENCASMESCHVMDDNTSMMVEAHNTIGAVIGDKVRVVTSSKNFLKSSFVVYVIPLIALIFGAVIGQVTGERLGGVNPDLLSALIGVAFLVGAFLTIRVGSKALPKDAFMPRIVEILPEL